MTHPFRVGLNDETGNRIGHDNPLPVKTSGVISTRNSYYEPMLADQDFEGEYERCSEFANIEVTAFSDVDSTSSGLTVSWSSDGINEDLSDSYTLTGSTAINEVSDIKAGYFKVTYVNSSTVQHEFRLQTIMKS